MISAAANITTRLLHAAGVATRETAREVLLVAVAHQLPQLSVEDIGDVLAEFPPRPDHSPQDRTREGR
jgi:hypothetical protein